MKLVSINKEPVKQDDNSYTFKNSDKIDINNPIFLNSRLSPKFLVFPQTEKMFSYTTDTNSEDCNIIKPINKENLKQAILGIRPCDAASFGIVEKNFDTEEYKDPFWINSYKATTFIGLACDNPASTCFCTTANSGPYDEKGLDILLITSGDSFIGKILTDKGEEASKIAGWTKKAPADSIAAIEKQKKEAESKITSSVSADKIKDKDTLELYNASFWEEEAFACLNCGTCAYVCPTCWCFDIQDEVADKKGIRMRNWDSCMFPLFTTHGSGHNPRDLQYQRARQRFMHKLKYYQDKYQSGIQCVGCGRCIRLCPVNIDIRRICDIMNS
ncbi:MAG: 4Fe-4S dicluster domain-containing protein [Deltaproteobacteria bacterium]|nr:4Fe-4S dicluster domain-containing protein [Deltaproteobacteria bacterium]